MSNCSIKILYYIIIYLEIPENSTWIQSLEKCQINTKLSHHATIFLTFVVVDEGIWLQKVLNDSFDGNSVFEKGNQEGTTIGAQGPIESNSKRNNSSKKGGPTPTFVMLVCLFVWLTMPTCWSPKDDERTKQSHTVNSHEQSLSIVPSPYVDLASLINVEFNFQDIYIWYKVCQIYEHTYMFSM